MIRGNARRALGGLVVQVFVLVLAVAREEKACIRLVVGAETVYIQMVRAFTSIVVL